MSTITRVAEAASVSYATAWRAVNNDPAVSAEVARRVREAMDRIGYVARRRSRRPPTSRGIRTRNIALLLLRSGATVAAPILHEIERVLRDQDLNLIFACIEPDKPLPEAVRSGNVDGIIGYGEFPQAAVTAKIKTIPAVWMMTRADTGRDPWGDRVKVDSQAIGHVAATYLADRGHKQLAYLRLEERTLYEQERLRGFLMAAEEKGLPVQVFRSPADAPSNMRVRAEQLVEQWMRSTPRATGLFVATDRETEFVHWQLERCGVDIGQAVQIVSCDNDEEVLQRLDPRPASIDLNRPELARVVVDRLMWRMTHGLDAPPVAIHVAPILDDLAPGPS